VLVATLVIGLSATASPASAASARPAPGRAMWVWDRPPVDELVGFASEQGVGELFVSAPNALASSPDLGWYRDLRTATRAAGIRVQALGSETTWIDRPKAALAWQSSALSTGLFDGVHYDVEPWIHPRWGADRTGVARSYLALLDDLARATALPVEADLAFWLDEVKVNGQRLDVAAIARVDAVSVLTYRTIATGPDSITALGAKALDAGARAGKPVRLSVETRHLGDDPVSAKQSFYGHTRTELDRVLDEVDAAEASSASYRGMAAHDRTGWVELAP
jgi:hypothetical protein